MKITFTIVLLFLLKNLSSQQTFTIHLGHGFYKNECTMIMSYYDKKVQINDTILNKDTITSNVVIGLAESHQIKVPKKERKELLLIIDNKSYHYRFDRVKNKSELNISYGTNYIDFCLLQKRKFRFY